MLLEAHGPADTALMIEHLSDYKVSKGKHYDDDYRTILSWVVRWLQEQKAKALKTGGAPRVANAPAPMEQSQETKTEQERRISENERWMREYLDEAKEKQ